MQPTRRTLTSNSTLRPAWWVVIAFTLLAFGLRLYRLDVDSIWWDEGISLGLARGTWANLFDERATNIHPPLYFVLLKAWVGLAGDSVFATRGLTVLLTLPGVALAYNLACRAWNRRIALLCALLLATAPIFTDFAQDVRAYGLLPVLNLLMLALASRASRDPARRRVWVALAVVEAAAVLTHYLSAFAVAYVNVRLISALWPRRREVWRTWLFSQLGAVGLTLPWGVVLFLYRDAIRAQLALGSTPYIAVQPLAKTAWLLWTFLTAGHAETRRIAPLPLLAGVVLGGLLVATLWQLRSERRSRTLSWQILDWLLPTATMVAVIWVLRPLAHPRYALIWAANLWLWIGVAFGLLLTASRWPVRVVGAGLLAVTLALNVRSHQALWFNPLLQNHDVRGVAAYVRENAQPGDVALSPFKDQSLGYYDISPASVASVDFRLQDDAWQALADATAGAGHVFVLEYDHATRDPVGVTAFALERYGALERVESFWGLDVYTYRLDDSIQPPTLSPQNLDFGAIRLTGAEIKPAPSNDVLTVALQWQLDDFTGPLAVALQLEDPLGNKIAQDDRLLFNPLGDKTDRWRPGDVVTTFHLLPLTNGTPPTIYTLVTAVYDEGLVYGGELRPVGVVSLLPPEPRANDLYGVDEVGLDTANSGELSPGLELVGTLHYPREGHPGDMVDVLLGWRATGTLPDLSPTLQFLDGEDIVVSSAVQRPGYGLYRTDTWSPDEFVLDRRRIRLPQYTPTELTLQVTIGDRSIELGEVILNGGNIFGPPDDLQFEMDVQFGEVARLIGYNIREDRIFENRPLRLNLYWEAVQPDGRNYSVFVHLIDDTGNLVGQQDGPPVGGDYPTAGWTSGDYYFDRREVRLEGEPQGAVHLVIGLYDPQTGERLPVSTGGNSLELSTQ